MRRAVQLWWWWRSLKSTQTAKCAALDFLDVPLGLCYGFHLLLQLQSPAAKDLHKRSNINVNVDINTVCTCVYIKQRRDSNYSNMYVPIIHTTG